MRPSDVTRGNRASKQGLLIEWSEHVGEFMHDEDGPYRGNDWDFVIPHACIMVDEIPVDWGRRPSLYLLLSDYEYDWRRSLAEGSID